MGPGMMRCFKVTVEYDGTDFAGFQYQNGQRSVQSEIERAIESLTRQTVRIKAAGRTDAGVHALGQVVSFQADTRIPIERMAAALNSALPVDVSAVRAEEVAEPFHARFSAKSRCYVYVLLNRDVRSALFGRYTSLCTGDLDLSAMREGARHLLGTRDFAAWANDTREVRSTVRTVIRFGLRRAGPFVIFRIEADGFLRSMVRNMVGTLLEVGSGKRPPDEIGQITESRDRSTGGPTAPPQGLCLVRVRY